MPKWMFYWEKHLYGSWDYRYTHHFRRVPIDWYLSVSTKLLLTKPKPLFPFSKFNSPSQTNEQINQVLIPVSFPQNLLTYWEWHAICLLSRSYHINFSWCYHSVAIFTTLGEFTLFICVADISNFFLFFYNGRANCWAFCFDLLLLCVKMSCSLLHSWFPLCLLIIMNLQ